MIVDNARLSLLKIVRYVARCADSRRVIAMSNNNKGRVCFGWQYQCHSQNIRSVQRSTERHKFRNTADLEFNAA